MPAKPSSGCEIESPTGCTKQLINVAASGVPAAELMRPAGTKPRRWASRNFASQAARCSGASAAARARATRWRTWSSVVSWPLAYFSASTSVLMACGGKVARLRPVACGAGVAEGAALRARVGVVWLIGRAFLGRCRMPPARGSPDLDAQPVR